MALIAGRREWRVFTIHYSSFTLQFLHELETLTNRTVELEAAVYLFRFH